MPTAILTTKLYIPAPQPNIVLRPRLTQQLNQAFGPHDNFARKLTLISAPAGFGKTTLISEWVSQRPQDTSQKVERSEVDPSSLSLLPAKVAWLSLEEGDNDLTRFLTYLVAALQTVAPELGQTVLHTLQSPQPPPTEALLTTLLNEITALSENIVLVFDDFHVIESQSIEKALTFLLEHLSPQMHLVIVTREDPRLPLPRLRARLIQRLNEALSPEGEFIRRLTLVSAPAGFGKTTLVSEWVNQKDEGRSQPAQRQESAYG